VPFQHCSVRVCAYKDVEGYDDPFTSPGTPHRFQVEARVPPAPYPGPIDSTFVGLVHFYDNTDIRKLVEELDAIGIKELIVHTTWNVNEYGSSRPAEDSCLDCDCVTDATVGGGCDKFFPPSFAAVRANLFGPDGKLTLLFAETQKREMDVILGLVCSNCSTRNEDWALWDGSEHSRALISATEFLVGELMATMDCTATIEGWRMP
jgi:hypothetical protein